MSLLTQGESNGVRPTHLEGQVASGKDLGLVDHRSGDAAEY